MAVMVAAGQVDLAGWVAVLCLAVLPLAIGAAILRSDRTTWTASSAGPSHTAC